MKIGIIGTRGIPNQYGGFEQFAEQFSVRMLKRGHDLSVYTSHRHTYNSDNFNGVKLIRCFDPEYLLGTTGQFFYDLNCILDSRKQQFDIILQLGYTSSTIWSWLFPSASILVTNMDGLEWKRKKYNLVTRRFLRFAEKWAVKYSDYLIADSKGIQEYLYDKYHVASDFIPYGATQYIPGKSDPEKLSQFGLLPNTYDLVIARFEPENNIEPILKAYKSFDQRQLILIGHYEGTHFGRRMFAEYSIHPHIKFLGPVYDSAMLNIMRFNCFLYLHGHSVGGTNPSLLEAMACIALICAHNNIFNRYVLEDDAFYFETETDLHNFICRGIDKKEHEQKLAHNLEKIENQYNWDKITQSTELCFKQWIESKTHHVSI
jgi:glycosyltransferase involved in cell wall biosynthesis